MQVGKKEGKTYVILWWYAGLLKKTANQRNVDQDIIPDTRDLAEEEHGEQARGGSETTCDCAAARIVSSGI